MKVNSIKRHLKEYSIFKSRKTTINNAFASALSLPDEYSEEVIKNAIRTLGQDPEKDLKCAYCDDEATTWDHINPIVEKGQFSGYGHKVWNLIPCCKNCNSKKMNKPWTEFLDTMYADNKFKADEIKERIKKYISGGEIISMNRNERLKNKLEELNRLKDEVLQKMQQADDVAQEIRNELKYDMLPE